MREMYASELMTPDPITVESDTPIPEVARKLREHNIGSIPVVESRQNKRLLGIITDRDIAVRCTADEHDPQRCTAAHHMSRDILWARAGDEVQRVMALMEGAQVRRIPVVDDEQRVIGIVAQADLAVDAVEEEAVSPLDVAEVLERISEPAHPEKKG